MLNKASCLSSASWQQNRFSWSIEPRLRVHELQEPLRPGGPGKALRAEQSQNAAAQPSSACCRVVSVMKGVQLLLMGFMRADGTGLWRSALEQQILLLVLPHWHLVVDLAIMVFKNTLLVYVLQMSIGRLFLEAFHLAVYTFSFNTSKLPWANTNIRISKSKVHSLT